MGSTGRGEDRPWVVLITGEPGSGKSTLGAELSQALRVPFLARDDVRGGLLATAGSWGPRLRRIPTGDEAVDALVHIVTSMSALGVSCVVEYVVRARRLDVLERIADDADVRVIRTWCDDAPARFLRRTLDDRLLNRRPVLDALGYASIHDHARVAAERMRAVTEEMAVDLHLPLLEVDTGDGYEPGLDAIIDFAVGARDPT